MIKSKVTLIKTEGQWWRAKVTKMNKWSYLVNFCTHRHHIWYQGTIQYAASNDISFLGLDERPRTNLKVKGHRRWAVCVLWMLLVSQLFTYSSWGKSKPTRIHTTPIRNWPYNCGMTAQCWQKYYQIVILVSNLISWLFTYLSNIIYLF